MTDDRGQRSEVRGQKNRSLTSVIRQLTSVISRRGVPGVQCEPDQRGATEQHVDADQEPDRPGGGSWQTGKDDGSQRQVDNPARQHQAPSPRQLALVIEGVHDGGNSLQDEKCDQDQRQRQRSANRPSDQDSAGGDRQNGGEQRPPEPRSVAHHEGHDEAHEPADEKQPAQDDFDREGGDRRNDYGGGARRRSKKSPPHNKTPPPPHPPPKPPP